MCVLLGLVFYVLANNPNPGLRVFRGKHLGIEPPLHASSCLGLMGIVALVNWHCLVTFNARTMLMPPGCCWSGYLQGLLQRLLLFYCPCAQE